MLKNWLGDKTNRTNKLATEVQQAALHQQIREVHSTTKRSGGKKYCKTRLVRSETGEFITSRPTRLTDGNLLRKPKFNKQ